MIITKVINTTIDLFDPVDIYTVDIKSTLKKKLEDRYKKRCYQSILIIEIVSIKRHSSVIMVNNRLDGAAYVDVEFEAKGIVLITGEILHNCKIIEIHSNAITMEHEYAGIKLQKDNGDAIFKILKVGQKIPVVIQKVRYMVNQTSISAIATPFLPSITEEVFYNITEGLSPEETNELTNLMLEIDKEEDTHKSAMKEETYEFFKNLIYPYKVNQKYELNQRAVSLKFKPVALELKALLEIKSGVIVYPQEDNRSNKRLFWSKNCDVNSIEALLNCFSDRQ